MAKHSGSYMEMVRDRLTSISITFFTFENIGIKRMKNLISSYHCAGLAPRIHGNTHRLPKQTLTYEQNKSIVVSYLATKNHT